MTITAKAGNLDNFDAGKRRIDWLEMEWHETSKRILHKKTRSGLTLMLKFLDADPAFTQGDIVYEDENKLIAIEVLACDALVLFPRNMYEMAAISYETGNRHLPLFYNSNELLVPFEVPFFRLMKSSGYAMKRERRKLLNPLKTTVKPHAGAGEIDFSKMIKVAIPNE